MRWLVKSYLIRIYSLYNYMFRLQDEWVKDYAMLQMFTSLGYKSLVFGKEI